jgi:hypothetical protein
MVDTQTRHGIFLYGLTLLSGIGKIAATKYMDHKMVSVKKPDEATFGDGIHILD